MSYVAGQKLRASDLPQLNTCAEYQATANQTIATATDTTLAYGSTNFSTTLVTINSDAPGNSFTLNRAGIWGITITERWDLSNTTGERAFYLTVNGVFMADMGGPFGSAGTPSTHNVSIIRPFNSGDVIRARGFQSSGGNVNRLFSFTVNYGRINLNWLGG